MIYLCLLNETKVSCSKSLISIAGKKYCLTPAERSALHAPLTVPSIVLQYHIKAFWVTNCSLTLAALNNFARISKIMMRRSETCRPCPPCAKYAKRLSQSLYY